MSADRTDRLAWADDAPGPKVTPPVAPEHAPKELVAAYLQSLADGDHAAAERLLALAPGQAAESRRPPREIRRLMEARKSGEFRDKKGRRYCLQDGKEVPCPKKQAGAGGGSGDAKPKAKPATKTPAKVVPERKPSERAARAKAAHKLVDARIQRYAEEHNEPRFAKAMGGVSFPDGEPVDVAIPDKSGKLAHGVELKTMTIGGNDKLTMNSYAQVRKIVWEQDQKATFHTIVSDDRAVLDAKGDGQHDDSKRVYYYRRGVAGSARVGTMYRAKDEAELKRLMTMPEDQLPEGAGRTDGHLRQGKWEFFADEGGRGYRNADTGQEFRAKK